MAIIWFVKQGQIQVGPSAAEKSLDWCVKNLGLSADDWIANLEQSNLIMGQNRNPGLTPYGGFRHVIVGVDDDDHVDRNDWKKGFYLLKKDAVQVRKILEER